MQSHNAQGNNVELTPKVPCSDTDSIKVTLMTHIQVMDAMGIIPDSHSEVVAIVSKMKGQTNLSQPPNPSETVSMPPKSSNPVLATLRAARPEHQMRDSKSLDHRYHKSNS